MSSKQGLRTSVKRLSAGLPAPRIVPKKNQKKQKTPTVKTLSMNIDASCNTVDLDVKTLTGETITLDVKANSLAWLSPVGATKDTLIAQLNILIEEFNKILHQVVYVSLTSLMVTIGKVKAIQILLARL